MSGNKFIQNSAQQTWFIPFPPYLSPQNLTMDNDERFRLCKQIIWWNIVTFYHQYKKSKKYLEKKHFKFTRKNLMPTFQTGISSTEIQCLEAAKDIGGKFNWLQKHIMWTYMRTGFRYFGKSKVRLREVWNMTDHILHFSIRPRCQWSTEEYQVCTHYTMPLLSFFHSGWQGHTYCILSWMGMVLNQFKVLYF